MSRSTDESKTAPELAASIRAALAEDRLEVPMLPEAAGQIVALASDPDCEARSLVDVIKRDQALMAHLMRMANSALLAPEVPIVSLQLAVGRLGLSRVRDIAVAAALQSKVFRCDCQAELVRRLFRLALATGYYSQEVARFRRRNVEVAFLAGLMHDVAAPALCDLIGPSDACSNSILAVLEEFAPETSAAMIRSWGLPESLAVVAHHKHSPDDAGGEADLCRSVWLAEGLAIEALEPERAYDLTPIAAALNLYPDDVDRLRERRDYVVSLVETSV